MKIGSRCPYCDDVLLTEYKGDFVITKICSNRIDHRISFAAFPDDEELHSIKIFVAGYPPLWAFWDLHDKMIWVSKYHEWSLKRKGLVLPWFDPDLTNYHKMCSKIKTYVAFS